MAVLPPTVAAGVCAVARPEAAASVRKELAVNLASLCLWAADEWYAWLPPILAPVLILLSLFLILLVLIQRGKGGGLAGAFGGAGGSSAFGSRAGDAFTRITIYVAAAWVLLIMILIKTTQPPAEAASPTKAQPSQGAPEDDKSVPVD
jgi:preprotein translocase subunit SecG